MAKERDIITVEPTTIEDAWLYPHLWATVQHEFGFLTEDVQLRIVALVTGVCHSCHDAPHGCQCWNDE